jgi:phosphoribosylanthranilate isomerase
MKGQLQVKVCGLTSERDVELAQLAGADYYGFITYAKSPRAVSLARAQELATELPSGRRVVVDVATSLEQLMRYQDAGFDYFQIHTAQSAGEGVFKQWSDLVGRERLWLAPRLKPGERLAKVLFTYAASILLDTYAKGQVGGTGQTGDWEQFQDLRQTYPDMHWILAGGLGASNVLPALAATGAQHIDVNSGVESAPGIKDAKKLSELFRVLRAVRS